MPKARYLAPWQQPDLVAACRELAVEEVAALAGKPAIYHCISRVVDRRFAFGDAEKEQFVALMRRYERFCQVRVLAYCVMSNHFHILLEVPSPPPERGRDWSDEQLLDHLACLYSPPQLAEIRWQLALFRDGKAHAAAVAYRETFLRRMWDLSEFMKSLKHCFSSWFNKVHERRGTLWEERFKSVLVEDGHAARVMAAYIDLNPVRAAMVADPKDYRWCSYGEAVAGNQRAREGIQRVMFESGKAWSGGAKAAGMLASWRNAAPVYREVLGATLRRGADRSDESERGTPPSPAGEEALDHPVRAFRDGLVVGSRSFVDRAFRLTRDRFGPKRRDGARRIRGMPATLCAMRDLKAD